MSRRRPLPADQLARVRVTCANSHRLVVIAYVRLTGSGVVVDWQTGRTGIRAADLVLDEATFGRARMFDIRLKQVTHFFECSKCPLKVEVRDENMARFFNDASSGVSAMDLPSLAARIGANSF